MGTRGLETLLNTWKPCPDKSGWGFFNSHYSILHKWLTALRFLHLRFQIVSLNHFCVLDWRMPLLQVIEWMHKSTNPNLSCMLNHKLQLIRLIYKWVEKYIPSFSWQYFPKLLLWWDSLDRHNQGRVRDLYELKVIQIGHSVSTGLII